MTIRYDEKYDILYAAIADRSNSYGDEIADGVVVMRDMETGEITGVTVFGPG